MLDNTTQYNTIKSDKKQYNIIQYNTVKQNTKQ